jgi:hypothetical protein
MGDFILGYWHLLILLLAIFFCNIPTCQMEGPIYLFGPTIFIKCMVPLYAQFYFCLTFLNGIDFLCFLSVFFFLFGNYGNFDFFLKLHKKYEKLQFFL